MKIYKSEIYEDIPQPENFNELMELLTGNNYTTSRNVRLWRGQSNIEWAIDSSAYRRVLTSKRVLNDIEFELASYEKSLLRQATHKGFSFQDGRVLNDLELLAKLQHHGAATRLVDFSRSSLIALWFCVSANLNKVGVLIGLHTDYLGGYEGISLWDNYSEIIEECKSINHPLTFEPTNVSARIAAQHAQLVFSKVSSQKTGSLWISGEKDSSIFIAITPELKKELELILERGFDLRLVTLFPDLDGFGKANSINIDRNKMYRW